MTWHISINLRDISTTEENLFSKQRLDLGLRTPQKINSRHLPTQKHVIFFDRSVALRVDAWEGREPIFNCIICTFHHIGWINRLLKIFNLKIFFPILRILPRTSKYLIILTYPSRDCFDILFNCVILTTFLCMLFLFFHSIYFAVLCCCCSCLSISSIFVKFFLLVGPNWPASLVLILQNLDFTWSLNALS